MSFLRRLFRISDSSAATPPYGSADLICLAFSRKYGGHCVAGLDRATGRWIRPVTKRDQGTLLDVDCRLRDSTSPHLLDVLRIPLGSECAEAHQPENVLIRPGAWSLVGRPASSADWNIIDNAVVDVPLLFGSAFDRLPHQHLIDHPAAESLMLVQPTNVWFISQTGYQGRRQARLGFQYGRARYRLSITDPVWDRRVQSLPEGEYGASDLGVDETDLLLTVSLGEPFQGDCYKLVAAIIQRP